MDLAVDAHKDIKLQPLFDHYGCQPGPDAGGSFMRWKTANNKGKGKGQWYSSSSASSISKGRG